MTTIIRTAGEGDAEVVRQLHLSAFDDSESQEVAELAARLLGEADSPETLNLLAVTDGTASGHVAFSKVSLSGSPELRASILAPLGVAAGLQRSGIGSQLVRYGMQHLTDAGVALVFVYGDPGYYGRFDFSSEVALTFEAPYPLQYPHGWQARVIDPEVELPSSCKLTCVTALSDPGLW
ncbi:MAG: N-acetyltransferase [Pseudomonadota bacterium]